ncbi:DUF3391 domain-containing protein [Agrobacterium tumefaciens]|uniref:DUF3391 domain-containing protein n=2 Tax=Agrobacterium tumefaciens TaxID=358 RepID=A0AA44F6C0_AGRTU|nr:DUF3391 domain-containing protein [Agrobacterium tumefaciens]NTC29655.1 DUF3391 domain-containing protein [Agrobacterium tumefaciens]
MNRPEDVEALKASGVRGVIINTNDGADVAVAAPGKTRHAVPKAQVTRALQTIEHSKPLIKAMFGDARMGNSVPVGNATQVVEHIAECMTDSSRALIEVSRLKTRDEYTFLHSIAVTALMVHRGRSIKIGERTAQTWQWADCCTISAK